MWHIWQPYGSPYMSQKIRTSCGVAGSLFFIIYIPTLRVGIYIIKNKNPNEKNQNLLIFFIRCRNTISISRRNRPKWVAIRYFFRVLNFCSNYVRTNIGSLKQSTNNTVTVWTTQYIVGNCVVIVFEVPFSKKGSL